MEFVHFLNYWFFQQKLLILHIIQVTQTFSDLGIDVERLVLWIQFPSGSANLGGLAFLLSRCFETKENKGYFVDGSFFHTFKEVLFCLNDALHFVYRSMDRWTIFILLQMLPSVNHILESVKYINKSRHYLCISIGTSMCIKLCMHRYVFVFLPLF